MKIEEDNDDFSEDLNKKPLIEKIEIKHGINFHEKLNKNKQLRISMIIQKKIWMKNVLLFMIKIKKKVGKTNNLNIRQI